MQNKITSLHSTFSVNGEVSDEDTRFLQITIDVLHTGQNLNGSVFEKDIVDSCIDSIKNTPVLGFIEYDEIAQESDFKGHEHILTKTENGVEEKYYGRAYGVIPESCNPRWFAKMCSDGHEREFLQVDALLWEKFSDATDIVNRDIEKSQSMELEISSAEGYEDDNGIFHFTNFRFDGCCILGDGVEPAMVDANVRLKEVQFAMNDYIENIQSELNDKFVTFTKLVNEKSNQGGVRNMPNTNTDFAQTVMEQFTDIAAIVNKYESMQNRWGDSVPRYYLADIQDSEVIVVDEKDNYRYYGFQFVLEGDKPVIDFSNGTRKKIRFENYEEGSDAHDGAFDFGKHIADMEEAAFAKVSDADAKIADAELKFADAEQAKIEAETNYAQVKADYDEIKPKYDEYVQAEEQREVEELNAQKDAKFAEFEDLLSENAEFTALKESKDEMSVEDIENECLVLYAKACLAKSNFSKSNTTLTTVGVFSGSDDEADDFVHPRYGNISIKR